MQAFQVPVQRITEPPTDRWRKCPKHVLTDLQRYDRRLHVWWHRGKGAWQVVEFLNTTKEWSFVMWWKAPIPTSLGILQALSAKDAINKHHRHVQDMLAHLEREKDRVRVAKVSEREYLQKHAVEDQLKFLQGKFTTSFRPDDKPRPWRPIELPTDLQAEA